MIGRVSRLGLLVFSLCAGCMASSSAAVRTPASASIEPRSATSAPLDKHTEMDEAASLQALRRDPDAFLVHAESGKIELRSTQGAPARELAANASLAIYDPALELIWFVAEDRLNVLDLRARSFEPIEVVRGVPEVSVLSIHRANSSVSTNEACQGPSFTLLWNEAPSFEAYDRDVTDTSITGRSWLQTQLNRPERAIGARRDFEGERVRLPRKLLDCEEPSSCATTAKFGGRDLELVLVRDKAGGDCWNRACIVRDPRTNRYASPPDLQHWTTAAKAKPGPCGLYYFDQAQRSYLIGNRLCFGEPTCQDLEGEALGWLQGGDIVGDIGDTGEEFVEDGADAE